MAEIDRIANTPCPLAEREQRIAKLEEEIDRLQRTEEVIISHYGCATRAWIPALDRVGRYAPAVRRRVMSRIQPTKAQ